MRKRRKTIWDDDPLKDALKKSDTNPPPGKLPDIKFCDKCKKVVPDNEIHYYEPNAFHNGYYSHQYYSYENIAPRSSGMNCCMSNVLKYCGSIVEPADWEYFFYVTWGVKVDVDLDD